MNNMSRRQYIKIIVLEEYCNKRFTAREITERFCRELFPGINPRQSTRGTMLGEYFIKDPAPYESVYRDVNYTLYSLKRKKIRLFFHSVEPTNGPTWFHQNIATHKEVQHFADSLYKQGGALQKEANLIREWDLNRNKPDNKSNIADVVIQLTPRESA